MYSELFEFIEYFKKKPDLQEKSDELIEFLGYFDKYLVKNYDEIIGEFCYDEEGWYDLGEIRESLELLDKDELIGILSSIIVEDKYLKNLLFSEIKNGFIYSILTELQKKCL